jgi:hypothetical protein
MLFRILTIPYLAVYAAAFLIFCCDIYCAAKEKKTLAEKAKLLFCTEHWIGTQQYAEYRKKGGQLTFALAMLLYLAWNLASNSCVPAFIAVSEALYGASLFFCVVKILLFSRYGYGRFLLTLLCLTPLLITSLLTGNMVFFITFFLLFANKDVFLRPILQIGTVMITAGVAVVFFMQRMNWIPMDGDGFAPHTLGEKLALGFIHHNTTGYLLAFLILAWFLLRYDHLKWWDWIIMLAPFCVIVIVTGSRASALTVAAALMLGMLFRYAKALRESCVVKVLLCAMPALVAGVSFAAAALYRADSAFWAKLDAISSGRLFLFHGTMESFGVTMWGQTIRTDTLFTLDNVYLYLFYRMGIWNLLLFVIGMTLLAAKLWRRGCWGEVAVLTGMLFMGALECIAFWPAVNVAMWLLPALLWSKEVYPFYKDRKNIASATD